MDLEDTYLKHKDEGIGIGKVSFGVITLSTSRSKNIKIRDIAIDIIKTLLEEAGHEVSEYRVIADDIEQLRSTIKEFLNIGVDAIITTGGTGLSKTDVTIAAVKPLCEKDIDGFGELFRYLSYKEIGSASLLSMTYAGILKDTPIFCLPGSPKGVRLALSELLIPEILHVVKHLRTG